MPTPAIAKAAKYVHRDMMLPRELDDQIAQEAARLRVSPVALIWNILTRHFAPATAADEGLFILGQGPHGPVTFIPDSRGGHIEFQGKVWRVEK